MVQHPCMCGPRPDFFLLCDNLFPHFLYHPYILTIFVDKFYCSLVILAEKPAEAGFSAPAHQRRLWKCVLTFLWELFWTGSSFVFFWTFECPDTPFCSGNNYLRARKLCFLSGKAAGNSLACFQVFEQRYKLSKLSNCCVYVAREPAPVSAFPGPICKGEKAGSRRFRQASFPSSTRHRKNPF